MLIFCILILPFCYILWKEICPRRELYNGVASFYEKICAIAAGCVYATIRFFAGSFVDGGGFGIARFVSAFVDYAALPVLFALIVCAVFREIQGRFFKRIWTPDWTGFVLLTLIPVVLVSAIRWGTEKNLILLVLTPLLWAASAFACYPLFTFMAKKLSVPRRIIAVAGIIAQLFLASAVWWLFYRQETVIAFLALAAALAVPTLTIVVLLKGTRREE